MFIPIWIIIVILVLYAFNLIISYSIKKYLKTVLGNGGSNFESMDFIYNLKGIRIKGHLLEDKSLEVKVINENDQTA